ncbi:hypothetical protein H7169_03420 [Candidatus Gracilibacteria bacterium]|nr:hypothetical protein [Candidatus Gracilibacteria bacterium]
MADFYLFHLSTVRANYDGLPVYKASYDFLLQICIVSKNFTREYKYTIGQELKNETISLILDIYRAKFIEKQEIYIPREGQRKTRDYSSHAQIEERSETAHTRGIRISDSSYILRAIYSVIRLGLS